MLAIGRRVVLRPDTQAGVSDLRDARSESADAQAFVALRRASGLTGHHHEGRMGQGRPQRKRATTAVFAPLVGSWSGRGHIIGCASVVSLFRTIP